MTSPPRVLIFGTGSIGAIYAYILSRAITPSKVYCICRSNYAIASTEGFTINSTIFGNNLNFKPRVARTVQEAVSSLPTGEHFDYIIITAKAIPSTPSIPSQIKPAVSPHTTLVLIQNGITIEQPYASLYPHNPLLSCVVYLPATQTSRATISHREVQLLHIGPYPSTSPPSHHQSALCFSALLQRGGATTSLHQDIQPQRFSKLLVNASWNPICALSRSHDAEFVHSSPSIASSTIKSLMLEIASIAQSLGYREIDSALVDHQLSRAQARDLPGIEPSMLADARSHARMEVDAIVGNAVRLAEQQSVQVPLLRAVYALVKALDQSFEKERQLERRGGT